MNRIYLLSHAGQPFYVGQSNDPFARLEGHNMEALRNHRSAKDKRIWQALLDGGLEMDVLFESPFFPDNDEVVTMWMFKNVFECDIVNVKGLANLPLAAAKQIPPASKVCRQWFEDQGTPVPEGRVLEPAVGQLNKVIVEKKTTPFYIEVAEVQYKMNQWGGENTPIIFYKWLSSRDEVNRVNPRAHGPYVDSLHCCAHFKVGERYVVNTRKYPAPDAPNTTVMWDWSDHVLATPELRAAALADRLERIVLARKLGIFNDGKLDYLMRCTIDDLRCLDKPLKYLD